MHPWRERARVQRSLQRPRTIAIVFVISAGCNGDDGRPAAADAGSTIAGDPDTSSTTTDEEMDATGEVDQTVAGPVVLPRLTATQYRNSLEALLGPGLPPVSVEPDTNPYLFYSIGAASTTLSELGAGQYETAADTVTHFVFDDPARRGVVVGCEPASPGDTCVSQFLTRFGRRAFRRPLSTDEHARWLKIAVDLAQPGAWEGLRTAVAGMLQSPHFLYRVDVGTPDPDDPDRLRYTGDEIASRLSFLLWDSMPDDALFAAADRGDLGHEGGIRVEAERLLADARARTAVQSFFAQHLDLGRLAGVTRDPAAYPMFSATMPVSMRAEVELLVDDVVFRDGGDVRRIFSTRRTFVNSELAALYGVAAAGATPIAFVPVELPDDGPRAGLLTLGAFLTMNAKQTQTSPTARGKYIRERVLCQAVPAPPDDVNTDIDPPTDPGETMREKLEQHRSNPACAGCHAFIDPPGLLFESFDPAGAYRELENGVPVDASGDLDGVPLANARALADRLADEPLVGRCMVTQLFRHAQGRLETADEAATIDDLDARFTEADYRFLDLVLALVMHDGFRSASPPEGA